MDRLEAMRAFIDIVDQGSLTAAARALRKSPPTMVRVLAELEQELGVVLLRRTTRRMALTGEGTLYLEHCRRVLAEIREVEEVLSSGQAEVSGQLRVTAPVLFGRMHVTPVVTELLRRHSQLQVELLLVDRVVNMIEEGLDAAIRIGHLADTSMIAARVGQVGIVTVASPALLEHWGRPSHPKELMDAPCLRFYGLASGNTWHFRDASGPLSVSVSGPLSVNQASAAVEACVAGLGFGRFLSYQVEPQVRAGLLEPVLEEFSPQPHPVSVLYPATRTLTKRLRTFVDFIKAELASRQPLLLSPP